MVVAVGLATSVVADHSSTRHQALIARQTSLTLDSLLTDRADLYAEYVPTLAIEAGKVHKITGAQLDKLLGVDFQATLVSARKQVDSLSDLGPQGPFAAYRPQLLSLRRSFDRGKALASEIESFFNGLGSKIDDRWEATFQNLSSSSETAGSLTLTLTLNESVGAVGSAYSAFTAGLDEENLPPNGSLESLLVTAGTPAEFDTAILGFPGGLGPKASAAWKAHASNPLSTKFRGYVELAIAVSLGHEKPPFATNAPAIGAIVKSEVEWETSLTNLVLASSADLRADTTSEATAATRTLYLLLFFMLLLILAAICGVLVLGRATRRPLERLVGVAESVRAGELDLPELDESGPKDLSLAAGAFNEMSATLRAVQTQAIALAQGDLDDPVLQNPLPGRTGGALQSALTELQSSVREREAQREELNERATRDFLTGLLNREAALEALELDLARVHRGDSQLVLAVLFIDLDELKKINDSLGHDRGDWALRGIADALRATTRASDVVARFGGDEFVVGWLGNVGSDAPAMLAKRIGEYVSRLEVRGDTGSLKLGCSIGVALSEPTDVSVATLIERADQALYVAKAKGRGRVHQLNRALL
jgi:diguanylate cyclase (GGDEF)-like protein